MSDKAELLREADAAFSDLDQAIEGLTEEQMLRVWLGTWGVREIMIHIAGWHAAMAPAFERIGRGEEPYPAGTYDDFDAWNDRFVTERAGMRPAAVRAELEGSRRDFLRAASALAEPHFAPGAKVRDLFDGAGPGHYREHAEQIRAWRAALPR